MLPGHIGGTMFKSATLITAAALAAGSLPSAAYAADPVVQPVQVGQETVRYERGVPTLDLVGQHGAVQIRPLPMDHGSFAFSVAVYNASNLPLNFDLANFSIQTEKGRVGLFTAAQLVGRAKNRAGWSAFGVALLGGVAAGLAASQRDTYSSSFTTPRAVYRSFYSAPSLAGQIQAAGIVTGTGFALAGIQDRLDRTRQALEMDVVQTSTVDPGGIYGGKIVLQKFAQSLPQRLTINVSWNGEQYPFTFQLAKAGTAAPAFSAITIASKARPTTTNADLPAPANAFAQGANRLRGPSSRPANLESIVQRTAEVMPLPTILDDGTSVGRFEAAGTELKLTAATARAFTETTRTDAAKAICTQRALSPLLHQGASIRTVFLSSQKREVGQIIITGAECGFY